MSIIHYKLAERFSLFQILAGISMVAIAAFLFISAVSAQEEGAPEEFLEIPQGESAPEELTQDEPQAGEEEVVVEEETVAEVEAAFEADAAVEAEDFGVKEAKIILPNNPLYGFKRVFRRVREVVTFNPIKKAELKLQHASQELVDANVVLEENPDDPEAIQIATESIEEYTEQMGEIQEDISDTVVEEEVTIEEEIVVEEGEANQVDKSQTEEDQAEQDAAFAGVQEALAGEVDNPEDLTALIVDRNIKFNKLFEQMKKRMLAQSEESGAPKAVLAMEDFADEAVGHVGDIVGELQTSDAALAGVMDGVMAAQGGSQFKDIRNIEVLQRLEDQVPEEAKAAIRKAQESGMKRFAKNFEGIHPDKRAERFLGYMDGVDGDETRHMQMLDVMKKLDGMPPEIRAQVEAAKDVMVNRLSDRYTYYDEKFQEAGVKDEFRSRIFGRYAKEFQKGPPDAEQLRVIQEIDDRILAKNVEMKADIEKHRDAGVEAFKAAFTDEESSAQAERYRELSKKLLENPDPTTFRLIHEMEESVRQDPKKREFIEAMERDARASFIARAQAEGDVFYDKISTNNPRDLQLVQDLQNEWRNAPDEFIPSPLMGFAPEGGLPAGFGLFGGPGGFPPGAGQGFGPPPDIEKIFEKFAERQSEVLTQNVGFINDPAIFAQFQGKFADAPPDIVRALNQQSNFLDIFNKKREFILQKAIVQEEFEVQASFGGEEVNLQASYEEKLKNAQSPEESAAIQAEYESAKGQYAERRGEIQGKLFNQILEGPAIFCDAACQKQQTEKFRGFRTDIQGQLEGFGGEPPAGFQIPGLPPELFEGIKAQFEGKFPGGFPGSAGVPQGVPFQGQIPGRLQKPAEPKPLLDETGVQVPDHKREEFLQRQAEKKRAEERKDFVPDTIFYRDDDSRRLEQPQPQPLPPAFVPKPDQPTPSDANNFKPPEFQQPPQGSFDQFRSPEGGSFQPPQGSFEGLKLPEGASFQFQPSPSGESFSQP